MSEKQFEPMSAEEFSAILRHLGLTYHQFAKWMPCDYRMVRRWVEDGLPIQAGTARFLRLMFWDGDTPERVDRVTTMPAMVEEPSRS